MKITKRQLRRIVKGEILEQTHRGNPNKLGQHPGLLPDDGVEPTDQKREELMAALQQKFGLKSRTTEEFGTSPGGVWINGESNVPSAEDGLPLFDYYLDSDPYTFGIHPDFEAFVIDNYGFAPEWNDPGTLMLWSLD